MAQLQVLQVETVKLPRYEVGPHESVFDDVLWLSVEWKNAPSNLARIVCALQQLDHIARTDYSLWMRVLLHLWPTKKMRLWALRRDQLEYSHDLLDKDRVSVGLFVRCFDPRVVVSLRELAVDGDSNRIPLFVQLLVGSRYLNDGMRAVDQLATASDTDTRTWYRLDRVGVSDFDDVPDCLQETTVKALAALARRGVEIARLPQLTRELACFYPASVVASLQALVPPCYTSDDVSTTMDRIFLNVDTMSISSIHCLFAAIEASRSVREVAVSGSGYVNGKVARWLAFALFTSSARHNLHKVKILGTLAGHDFDYWFRQVVLARDPVAELFDDERSSIEAHETTRISTTRVYLQRPNEFNRQVTVNCAQQTALRVITRAAKWWNVLLPGYGRVWVHEDDAVVTTHPIETKWRGVRVIPELAVHGDLMEMLSWLETIGRGVERLTFGGLYPAPFESPEPERVNLAALRDTFPNLRTLRLQSVRVDRLAHLYRQSDNGHWAELETLSLKRMFVRDGDYIEDVIELLRALSDHSHGLAKSLRSLKLSLKTGGIDYSRLLDAALAMLQANTQLQWFCLKLPGGTAYPANVRDAIRSERGKILPGRLGPMAIREKCALLSAVVAPLDSHVFSIIFAFAAIRCRRHVEFDEH